MKRARVLICFLAAGFGSVARAAPPPELPVETFFKKSNFSQVTFSPDGLRVGWEGSILSGDTGPGVGI